ncbi:MAG TPA: hypothetical protein VGF24_31620 [Vicinamibacterales bacterium]
MGSAAIGAWVVYLAFCILLVRGYVGGELGRRGCAIALVLWIAGYGVFRQLPFYAPFASYVAVLDIALVFVIFKGDVRLT